MADNIFKEILLVDDTEKVTNEKGKLPSGGKEQNKPKNWQEYPCNVFVSIVR